MSGMINVYNLTDVPTLVLSQRGLVSRHLQVGTHLLAPGEMATFDAATWAHLALRNKRLIDLEALFVGDVPPASYLGKLPKPQVPVQVATPPEVPVEERATEPGPSPKLESEEIHVPPVLEQVSGELPVENLKEPKPGLVKTKSSWPKAKE